MSVHEKKQERTKAKTAIKLGARRLISAVNREVDFESLTDLMLEMEKSYEEFLIINEEFESLVAKEENKEHSIVNGEDLVTYRENVKKSFVEAQEVFLKRRNEDKSKSMAVETVRVALKLEIETLANVITVADENLKSDRPNMSALQLDMTELQELSRLLSSKTSEMSMIGSSENEQDASLTQEIGHILGRARSQIRAIKLKLHECQHPDPIAHTTVSLTSPTQQVISPNSPGNDSEKVNQGKSFTTTPTLMSTHSSPPTQSHSTPSTVSNGIPATQYYSFPTTHTHNIPPTQSHNTPSTLSNGIPTTQSHSVPTTPSHNILPAQSHPPLSMESIFTSGHINNSSMSVFPPATTNLSTSDSQPMFTNPLLQAPPYLPASSFSASGTSFAYPASVQNTVPPLPIGIHHTQTMHSPQNPLPYSPISTLQTSLINNPSIVSPPVSIPMSNAPLHSGTSAHGHNFIPPSSVQLRKMELPTFSRHRRDWPEFKTVWRSVAESALRNKTALAHELKRSVRGEASKRIKSVYVTKPEAYDTMWQKLESYYEDVGASVQAALDDLHKLKPVASEDFKGLVELVDVVESAYSQLSELGNLNILTMRDVDRVTELLPNHLKVEWRRRYRDITPAEKIRPFGSFMKFLDAEREAISRMAENQPKARFKKTSYYAGKQSPKKYYKCAFPGHRKDNINHTTEECKEFQKLPISGKNGKYQLLKEINACYKCFGNHLRQNCPSNVRCNCDSTHHHKMLCDAKPRSDYPNEEEVKGDKKGTYVAQSDSLSLYPIYQVLVS